MFGSKKPNPPPGQVPIIRLPDFISFPNTLKRKIFSIPPPLLRELEKIRFCILIYMHQDIGIPPIGTMCGIQKIIRQGGSNFVMIIPICRAKITSLSRKSLGDESFYTAEWSKANEIQIDPLIWESDLLENKKRDLETLLKRFIDLTVDRLYMYKHLVGPLPSFIRAKERMLQALELLAAIRSVRRENFGELLDRISETVGLNYMFFTNIHKKSVAESLLNLLCAEEHAQRLDLLLYVLTRFTAHWEEILSLPGPVSEHLRKMIGELRSPDLVLPVVFPLTQN